MSPGGHLVSTAITCGAVYASTGSAALTAGVAVGGILIDVDHALDYVLFERRRDLRPTAFLKFYTEQRCERFVLLLHSYELLALLAALAWLGNSVWLWGYVLGASLHLPLDVVFNGKAVGRSLVAFYSFAYRWRAGFASGPLIGISEPQPVAGGFWRSFFLEFLPREDAAVPDSPGYVEGGLPTSS